MRNDHLHTMEELDAVQTLAHQKHMPESVKDGCGIIGKTILSERHGTMGGFDHDVWQLNFTDGTTHTIRSMAGYEDSNLVEVPDDELSGITWHTKDK